MLQQEMSELSMKITGMKKALRETQTLRAGRSNGSQKISPRRKPTSRGRRTAKI